MYPVSRQEGYSKLQDHQDHHRSPELSEEGDEVKHDVGYRRQVSSEGDQKHEYCRPDEKYGHARAAQNEARNRQ